MFTNQDVMELRKKTGAGVADCKKALTETNGDMEKAVDFLREKGIATAAKKASRIAAEGIVLAKVSGNTGALVEVNCETDFVAKGLVPLQMSTGLLLIMDTPGAQLVCRGLAVCRRQGIWTQ